MQLQCNVIRNNSIEWPICTLTTVKNGWSDDRRLSWQISFKWENRPNLEWNQHEYTGRNQHVLLDGFAGRFARHQLEVEQGTNPSFDVFWGCWHTASVSEMGKWLVCRVKSEVLNQWFVQVLAVMFPESTCPHKNTEMSKERKRPLQSAHSDSIYQNTPKPFLSPQSLNHRNPWETKCKWRNNPPMMATTPTAKPNFAAKASGIELQTPTKNTTTKGSDTMVFLRCHPGETAETVSVIWHALEGVKTPKETKHPW